MPIAAATFLQDSIKLIRDRLQTNITDPLVSTRPSTQKFVMTSYPKRSTTLPFITIRDSGISTITKLGMQSTGLFAAIPLEIRIWARNEVEKDNLTDQVINWLRSNQYTASTGTVDGGMYDFKFLSAVNVDEDGDNTAKSKVLTVEYREVVTT